MENKELKKSVQLELNEEMLGMVTGGIEFAETWNPLPTTGEPGVIISGMFDTQPENDMMPVGAITEA